MSGTTIPVVLPAAPRTADRLTSIRWFLRRNPRMIIGGGLVLAWLLVALFARQIAPYDPTKVSVADGLLSPSPQHWLGTDDLGRDVLSRVIVGSQISRM